MSGFGIRGIGRRGFLVQAGRGALGFAVLGLTACDADREASAGGGPGLGGSAAGLSWRVSRSARPGTR